MLYNIYRCLRICAKNTTFAPFLQNLKISIKNMKNLTFLRFCLCAVMFTLFSTSVVWGTSYCGETISSNDGTCNAILTCNSPSANTYVLTVTSDDPNFEGISGDNWYCYTNLGNYHMTDNYTWDATNKVLTFTINSTTVPQMHTCMYLRFNGVEKLFCTIQFQIFDWPSSATCSYEPTPEPSCDTKHFYYVKIGGTAYDHVYMWNSSNTSEENAAWPGVVMSTTVPELSILGASIYEISYEGANYDKVIFNDGGSNQTADLDIKNCKFYMDGTWYNTIEDVEAQMVYFVNTPGWADANVKANIWKNGGAVLGSSEQMHYTGTTTKQGNYKVFYYYNSNLSSYDRIQFHNNGANYSGTKTLEKGNYFNYADDCWYTSIKSLNIDYSSSWHKIDMEWTNKTKTVMTAVASLPTGSTSYQFYIKGGGEEYYRNSGTMTNSNCTNWKMDGASNCWITADVPGDYIFNYDFAENKLSVIYPPYMTSAACSSSTTTTITLAVASTRGTKYHVVDATHGVDQIVTPAAGLITVTGLTPSTEYTFTVTAMDNNDTESVNNASSTCTTMDPPSSVPANREDLTECQVLSVIGTTKYTPMGISNRQGWSGEKGEAVTIGAKGDNNVWCMYDGVASALILHESSNVQLFSKIHFEVWTAEAMTIDFGLLCWLNSVYNEQDGGPGTYQRQTITTTAGSWTTVEYTLTNLTTYAYLANVSHLYFYNLNKKEVYLTNAYFYNDDNTKPVLTSATSNGVSGTDATLTVTATYKGASINTFRVTNTTTGDVYDRTADGSNHITIPDIYPCESYSLSVRAINVYCILSDEEQIIPINGESLAANSPLIRSGMTVSADAVGLPLADAIDNNTASRWASGGSAINVPHWFQIDLGSVRDVTSWKIAWEASCPKDYYLEGSVDGTNYYPLLHETTKPTNASAEASPFNDYDTYTFTAAIGVRYLKVRSITNNTGYGMSIWEMQAYGDCYTASDKPVTTFALLESQELNSMSTAVNATIEVGAYDYATEFDDMYYKLSITPTGGSTTILDNQTATSGLITLADLEPGTEYTVVITARDGNNGNLADNSVTVVFTTLDVDPTICSREGGVGSGQSFAGASPFTAGFAYSVRKGDPGKLLISARIDDTDGEIGRVLLNFHSHSTNGDLYAEVELAAAAEHARAIVDREVTIPVAVAADEYASLSIKFEVGSGVRFTDRMLYNLKDGGCAPEYFDIYHWDDAPVGERTSYAGGNIVLPIRYFRHFDTNWTTISVPFEVERVAVYDETDHMEYPLFPRFHNNSKDVEGYYWLKTFPNWDTDPVEIKNFQATWQQLTVTTDYDGWDGGNISDAEETWLAANVKPAKNTPYAIKFPYADYYETNWVIFYGAAFQTIASDFTGGTSITLTNENYDYDLVKLQCNNTMHPSLALTNIYMLEEGTDLFTRRESQAVPAFESYVIGTHEVQARYSVLRWSGSTPSTTDIDNRPTTADGAGEIFTVSGIRVASFADNEQMEQVLNTLNAGVYVVRVGTQINKVFVR